jgi:hypothetical protein
MVPIRWLTWRYSHKSAWLWKYCGVPKCPGGRTPLKTLVMSDIILKRDLLKVSRSVRKFGQCPVSACSPSGAMHNGLCPELIRAIATEIWAFEIYAKWVTGVSSEERKVRKSTPQCSCHEMSKKILPLQSNGRSSKSSPIILVPVCSFEIIFAQLSQIMNFHPDNVSYFLLEKA